MFVLIYSSLLSILFLMNGILLMSVYPLVRPSIHYYPLVRPSILTAFVFNRPIDRNDIEISIDLVKVVPVTSVILLKSSFSS